MTQDLLIASRSLQRKERKARDNWTQESQERVQLLKKYLKDKLKHAEENWRTEKSKKLDETGAKTWQNVKRWAGWQSTSQPIILKDPSRNNIVTFGASKLC